MVDRVILDVSGLKVSKAGFDVKTAADVGLIFNSNWAQLKVWMKSAVFCEANITTPVYFGKTFINRPLITFHDGVSQRMNNFAEYGFFAPSTSRTLVQCTTYTDRFEVWVSNTSPSRTYRYIVWDFDL